MALSFGVASIGSSRVSSVEMSVVFSVEKMSVEKNMSLPVNDGYPSGITSKLVPGILLFFKVSASLNRRSPSIVHVSRKMLRFTIMIFVAFMNCMAMHF